MRRFARLGLITLLGAAVAAAPSTAGASPLASGRSTFTQITTPGKDTLRQVRAGAVNSFTVAGRTSSDVTAVDIYCLTQVYGGEPTDTEFADAVTVVDGQFATVATYPSSTSLPPTCRLLALPSDLNPTNAYLGQFTGPLLRSDSVAVSTAPSSGTPYSYSAYAEEAGGLAILHDAGDCTLGTLTSVALPEVELRAVEIECAFALLPTSSYGTGTSTRSGLRVDGRNAYLPSGVHDYLSGTLSLPVTQTVLTVKASTAANGDVTVSESAPVVRCTVADTYPPTTTSCPSLASTGVTFQRVSTFFRGGHQVRFRDSFTSADRHAHTLSLLYQSLTVSEHSGGTQAGFIVPGHGTTFQASKPGQVFTGLGTRAASVLIRSGLHSAATSPADDTYGETWSRSPSKLAFDSVQPDLYSLAYSLTVPAAGATHLGFALSESPATATVGTLDALAVKDMTTAPTITAPRADAALHTGSTTVSGVLRAGANGLPTSVTVDGHKARITAHGATSATYTVTFTESAGAHRLTATAVDVAGNVAASRTITVHNG